MILVVTNNDFNNIRLDNTRLTTMGFTIVELLIVIVVISILAAISVSAYSGITNRASDDAVISDLRNYGVAISLKQISEGTIPQNEGELSSLGLSASKNAYGNHLQSGGASYNLLYCSTVAGYSPATFVFIARSKSGKVYAVKDGGVTEQQASVWSGGWGIICPALLGVSAGDSSAGVWLYDTNVWRSWVK